MAAASNRKTSLTLSAAALDTAKDFGINVSAVAEAALQRAIDDARRRRWLEENTDAFAAQSEWHERNGHSLVGILVSPGGASWNS